MEKEISIYLWKTPEFARIEFKVSYSFPLGKLLRWLMKENFVVFPLELLVTLLSPPFSPIISRPLSRRPHRRLYLSVHFLNFGKITARKKQPSTGNFSNYLKYACYLDITLVFCPFPCWNRNNNAIKPNKRHLEHRKRHSFEAMKLISLLLHGRIRWCNADKIT